MLSEVLEVGVPRNLRLIERRDKYGRKIIQL